MNPGLSDIYIYTHKPNFNPKWWQNVLTFSKESKEANEKVAKSVKALEYTDCTSAVE